MKRTDSQQFYQALGSRIRKIRTQKRLSQAKMAETLEISRTSYMNVERGALRMPVYLLKVIADELDVPLAELLPTKDEPENRPLDASSWIRDGLKMVPNGR